MLVARCHIVLYNIMVLKVSMLVSACSVCKYVSSDNGLKVFTNPSEVVLN